MTVTLSTFFQKQLAEEIVAHIEGVVQVVNRIEVGSSDQGRLGDVDLLRRFSSERHGKWR